MPTKSAIERAKFHEMGKYLGHFNQDSWLHDIVISTNKWWAIKKISDVSISLPEWSISVDYIKGLSRVKSHQEYEVNFDLIPTEGQLSNFYKSIPQLLLTLPDATLGIDVDRTVEEGDRASNLSYKMKVIPGYLTEKRKTVKRDTAEGMFVTWLDLVSSAGLKRKEYNGYVITPGKDESKFNSLAKIAKDAERQFGLKSTILDMSKESDSCQQIVCNRPQQISDSELFYIINKISPENVSNLNLDSRQEGYYKSRWSDYSKKYAAFEMMAEISLRNRRTIVNMRAGDDGLDSMAKSSQEIANNFKLAPNSDTTVSFNTYQSYDSRTREALRRAGSGLLIALGSVAIPFMYMNDTIKERKELRRRAVMNAFEEYGLPTKYERGEAVDSCVVMMDVDCAVEKIMEKESKELQEG